MQVKLLTIPFDPVLGNFNDQVLQEFLSAKQVCEIKHYFFQHESQKYLVFCITYHLQAVKQSQKMKKGGGPKEDWRSKVKEEDLPLFNTVRDWRMAQARKEGIPPYVICTNMQLAKIIAKKPKSLNQLSQVEGIGSSKIKKYGAALLSFFKDAG
ncbi:MAG: hypothetical protein CR997_00880 [Acidobacteria bacterium]|nr:MAG: hypothetical protein CR997_00880 [Acidobacteriota bacterium]